MKLGTDHSSVRARNERLVLSLIRRHGALPKSEIARLTGLSAQTVSVIMRALEAEGLLVKRAPVRGKVGQPSVPMALAEDGAFFFGLKVGRRRTEVVLIDFLGNLRELRVLRHDRPTPDGTITFTQKSVDAILLTLRPEERTRVCGLGVGLPFQLWDWSEPLGLPEGSMDDWRERDLRAELAEILPWPVMLENDASAACNAELVFGDNQLPENFLYVFIGFFIGGGIVLNGTMFAGVRGNAGAIASMPVPDGKGGARQLREFASLHVLEDRLAEAGKSGDFLWEAHEGWALDDALVAPWVDIAARGLAHISAAAEALCDLEAVVIDGWMPHSLRDRLVAATTQALAEVDLAGSRQPDVLAGSVGPRAREIGAASLPLSERFLIEISAFAPEPQGETRDH